MPASVRKGRKPARPQDGSREPAVAEAPARTVTLDHGVAQDTERIRCAAAQTLRPLEAFHPPPGTLDFHDIADPAMEKRGSFRAVFRSAERR